MEVIFFLEGQLQNIPVNDMACVSDPSLLSFNSCVYAMLIPQWIFILMAAMRIPRISMAGTCHKVHPKCWRVPLQV